MTISVKNAANATVTISTIDDLLPIIQELKTQTVLGAGENRIGSVGGSTSYIDVTLTLDTLIYAAGDVLSDTATITNALRVNGGTGILQSIAVIDQDDQKAQLKIFLLGETASLGTKNAAPSISDADALKLLGAPIVIETIDYTDLGGVSIAGKDNLGKIVKAIAGSRNLFISVLNGSGTPTYTASGIKLRLGFLQD